MTAAPARQDFPVPSHIALLYRGDAELRAAAFAFLRPALDRPNEALFCFGEPSAGEGLLRALEKEVGRDFSSDFRAGRIAVGHANPDIDQQLENVIVPLEAFRASGFSLVRFVGIVAWNVPSFPPPEDFLWFESKLTELLAGFPVIALCPYDVAGLPARAIAYGALETHPFVLSDGALRENPQFIPHERYLRERLLRLPWLEEETAT
ncbi:MAG: MEDS domain-containing protein [Chloroflexota bacterium]|nr:MEDS domain-containing protein [Chloroflexota bacterium]